MVSYSLALGMSETVEVFGDTGAQPGYTCHISLLHLLQISLFSDREQGLGHDVQVVYLMVCVALKIIQGLFFKCWAC